MFIRFLQVLHSLGFLLTHHSWQSFRNVKSWIYQTSIILLASLCILVLLQSLNYFLKVSDWFITDFVHFLHFSLTGSCLYIQNHQTFYAEQIIINLWYLYQHSLPSGWICFWVQLFQQRFQKLPSFLQHTENSFSRFLNQT